jgi:hypothetical protein
MKEMDYSSWFIKNTMSHGLTLGSWEWDYWTIKGGRHCGHYTPGSETEMMSRGQDTVVNLRVGQPSPAIATKEPGLLGCVAGRRVMRRQSPAMGSCTGQCRCCCRCWMPGAAGAERWWRRRGERDRTIIPRARGRKDCAASVRQPAVPWKNISL